jgi:hypothetical protein
MHNLLKSGKVQALLLIHLRSIAMARHCVRQRLTCTLFALLFCVPAYALHPQSQNSESLFAVRDTAKIDLAEFAASIVKGAGNDYDRAERLLNWLSHNFKWLSTDYKKRTVKEIIARQGGNCFELATVYMSLIRTMGIRYRQVAEINIQPRSERRQKSAEKLVAERGATYSVFGEQHNDHRWVEIYDDRSREWIPADPSVGVIGLEPWLKSRVWFEERWAIDTSITNDMIVPIAIFTTDSTFKMVVDRSQYYLVSSFSRLDGDAIAGLPGWKAWAAGIAGIGAACRGAFDGKVNLHQHRKEIARLAEVYDELKREWQNERR